MSQAAQTAAEPKGQSVGLIIGAVAMTLLLASLGQTIVSTALPSIVSELGGLEHLTWVVIAYLLSSTVVAPIYGKLGDLYGRKIVLQAAIIIFLIGAALSAFANSMTFLIIARTDAGAVLGWDEAIARANLALENGADMAFVEAARTMEQVAAIPKLVNGPCLLNMVRAGKTPDLALGEAEAMGYRLTIMPSLLLSTIMMACDEVLRQVRETDAPPSSKGVPPVRERFRRWGADEWDALRTRFRDPVAAKAAE